MEDLIVAAIESAEKALGFTIPEEVWVEVLGYSVQKLEYIKKPQSCVKADGATKRSKHGRRTKLSKEILWGAFYGEGNIRCTCDQCGLEHEVDFDGGAPDFREAQAEIRSMGWQSLKIDGEWYDFCGEKCRNDYIKINS